MQLSNFQLDYFDNKDNDCNQKKPDCNRLSTLKFMMLSREADRREEILFKQGRGQFHVSSSGHEALAAFAPWIDDNDHLYCHYRDRALVLAMGAPLYQAALGFFAKAESSCGGRQLVNHFCHKSLNIMPAATPTGLQCLPAAGSAWAFKMEQKKNIAYCFLGDASTRQGEFFEALAFSIQEQLPVIFVVEDNGYGISTPTKGITPIDLGMIPEKILCRIDGRTTLAIEENLKDVIAAVRHGNGPKVIWVAFDRLKSHTASDDHSKYRSKEELKAISNRDPLLIEKQYCVNNDILSATDLEQLEEDIQTYVKHVYEKAELAPSPSPESVGQEIFCDSQLLKNKRNKIKLSPCLQKSWTMAEAWNHTLGEILKSNEKAIVFGEDVADPKGGVFGLTKGLSSRYQGQVINSPLAEATIAGLASGLSMSGYLPIFELQFADFIGPAFNQIVNQIATLRWRSNGQYKCPLILYAPCGSYIANGGPWHNQTNESWLAHAPGLKVYMPSDPNDVAHMLIDAAQGEDPVFMLLPKNLFFVSAPNNTHGYSSIHTERAKVKTKGDHITVVSWGNCLRLSILASQKLENEGIRCEVIDLCSIVPCDWQTINASIAKTGRLLIVQEDNKTCSFGQALISEICSNAALWNRLQAPPKLISCIDSYIGFSSVLEQAILPDVNTIVQAAKSITGGSHAQNI